MLREKGLLLIPAILLLVHAGDAVFRFRSSGGRNENFNNHEQYRNSYVKASSNVGGVAGQGSSHSSEQKPQGEGDVKGTKGLSAWGIIAIVVGVILLGTGGYYAFVFYPYICKKERNYDMIELTNVL